MRYPGVRFDVRRAAHETMASARRVRAGLQDESSSALRRATVRGEVSRARGGHSSGAHDENHPRRHHGRIQTAMGRRSVGSVRHGDAARSPHTRESSPLAARSNVNNLPEDAEGEPRTRAATATSSASSRTSGSTGSASGATSRPASAARCAAPTGWAGGAAGSSRCTSPTANAGSAGSSSSSSPSAAGAACRHEQPPGRGAATETTAPDGPSSAAPPEPATARRPAQAAHQRSSLPPSFTRSHRRDQVEGARIGP